MINLDDSKQEFEQAIEFFKKELSSIRTGRANPEMVENILVDNYGVKTPIKQIASIAVPEARTITIQPWDKNALKDIEKAIVASDLGISPVVESTLVRLTVPQMTEENRKGFVKVIGEKAEKAKVAIRQSRDKVKEEITKQEKNNELTEDDKYDLIKKLDEMTREYNEQAKELAEKKEKEVMSI